VSGAFRAKALAELAAGIDSMIALSPSLRAVPAAIEASGMDDEEFAHATIFPFTLWRDGKPVSIAETSAVHRALAHDMNGDIDGSAADRQVAAQRCLVGQPVRFDQPDGRPRCGCASARGSSPKPGRRTPPKRNAICSISSIASPTCW
jgi:hypothetical protein